LLLCGSAAEVPDAVRGRAQHTVDLLRARRMDEFVRATLDMLLCRDPERIVLRRETVARVLQYQLRSLTSDQADKYIYNTERLLIGPARLGGVPPRTPVLVVSGEHDTLTTPAICQATAADCPNGEFTLIRDADHMLPLERQTEFLDLMVRFFDGRPLVDLDYCVNPALLAG